MSSFGRLSQIEVEVLQLLAEPAKRCGLMFRAQRSGRLAVDLCVSFVRIAMFAMAALTSFSAHAEEFEEFVAFVDSAARRRDFLSLQKACSRGVGERFAFLAETGPYGGGAVGWRAGALNLPGSSQRFLVLHTSSVARDTTAFVFRVVREDGDLRIGTRIPDGPLAAYRVTHHRFDIRIDVSSGLVHIADRLSLERQSGSDRIALLRMGAEFHVESVEGSAGPIAFGQCGGVVALDVGSENEVTVRYRSEQRLVSSNEVLLGGRVWWLSAGRLPATHSARVRLPKGWVLAAMAPAKESSEGVFEYECRVPSTFFALSAGRYQVMERTLEGTTLRLMRNSSLRGTPEAFLEAFVHAHRHFERFGRPTWRLATVVFTDNYEGLPLAVPGLVTLSPRHGPEVMVRSVAQMWFGGLASATYLRNAWPEAFADYLTLCYWRTQYPRGLVYRGPQAEPTLLREPVQERPVFLAAPEFGHSIWDFARRKGCKVLEMAELELGKSTLERALRLFVTDAPASRGADWEDLQRCAEEAAGRHLRWFFDFWLGLGLWAEPAVRIANGGIEVSMPGMPGKGVVPVGVWGASGEIETEVFVQVDLGVGRAVLSGGENRRVVVDPYWRVVRKVPAEAVPPMIEQLCEKTLVVVPKDSSISAEALRKRLASLWPTWRVVEDGALSAADMETHDLLFWGSGKHATLWELGVRFQVWEKNGKALLGGKAYALDEHTALELKWNPRAKGRIVGRMYGVPQNLPWTAQAGCAVWDRLGRPVLLHTDPVVWPR